MIEKNVSVDEITEMLHKYHLLGLLPAIKKTVEGMSLRTKAKDTLAIESPFPLSEESVVHIKKMLGESSIPHEITINKNILAGFKARWKGKLYDGSAERIIRQLTK